MNTNIPKEELEVFKTLKDIKVVFDVGAREDLDMYELRPDLEYHLFEPVPAYCRKLIEKANGAKNVIVNEFGLAQLEGEFDYDISRQSFTIGDKFEMRLLVNTLDWYCEKFEVYPDFLKVDTEGADLNVIFGGKEAIKKVKYIQFEYWHGPIYFLNHLPDFNLSLMMEPRLRDVVKTFTDDKKYEDTLVPLTVDVIELIQNKLVPTGAGGNILGTRK